MATAATSTERARRWRAANPERAKATNRVAARKWYWSHRAEAKEHMRQWHAEHPDRHLRRAYGLTGAAYEALLEGQGRACGACGRPETTARGRDGKFRRLAVDYNHETGRIRGLLCRVCNLGIGHFAEDPDWLEAAARYLRRAAGEDRP